MIYIAIFVSKNVVCIFVFCCVVVVFVVARFISKIHMCDKLCEFIHRDK